MRKVVTAVFCDLAGSTALGERTDPEALRARLREYYDGMRAILERHGGNVEKYIGDAVMAVFGVPVAHEDDALRAVRAAWEMRAEVESLGLRARIGVNTGSAVTGEGATLVTGDAVNVAARLEQLAGEGEVLIGSETRRLVRDAVRVAPLRVEARGKAEPVDAFRLLDVDPEAEAIARRMDTPLVGRRGELDQLRGAYERTVRERRCHLFTVLGSAGLGKSRLAAEFLEEIDATVLTGRCLGYGEGIIFWPLVSVLKQAGAAASVTLDRVTTGGAAPSELFWAVRAQLEQLAAERPLVVLFDDVQWGEAMFLDLIDHIADLSRGEPLMLLCLARPELLDVRPAWGGGKLNATTILVEPLSPAESAELADAYGWVAPDVRERIVAMADGNPLFVEEVVALVREHGDVRLPSTVQALLQARLDGLGRAERAVVDGGAVEGHVFHRSAVLELTHAADIESPLVGLVRKELIHPVTPMLTGDHAFRFRHLLIRDAAYDALPKAARAELHIRFAEWLEVKGQELVELDEVLGYHLEQAGRYRRELGHPDAGLEARAGRHLGAAGSRAVLRSDAHGAANLLARALALMPAREPERSAALLEWIGILSELGERDQRLRAIAELEDSDNAALRMHGRVARLDLRLSTDPDEAVAETEALVDEALAAFARAGDDLGAAHTYSLSAMANWVRSRAVPTRAALEHQVEHAERAGARLLAGRAMMQLIGPLVYGPFEPDEVRAQIARLPVDTSPLARVNALYVEAALASREGRFAGALERLGRAAEIEHELGLDVARAINLQSRAAILRERGDLDAAATAYREAIAQLEETGQTSFRSTALINLADVLYERGAAGEAARLAVEGEELGAAEDVVNYAAGRSLRARIAADAGRLDEAESLAREGLSYAYETDFPDVHASAHAALGHVLARAGRRDEARRELTRGVELWRRYGYRVQADKSSAVLAEV